MPTASTSTAAATTTRLAVKPPVLSTSRPSDFMSPHIQSAHITSSGPPTMRVMEVKAAPGSKTRSRLQLLKEFTRAPTSEVTTSSLHMCDSHKGAAEANAARVAEERTMAESILAQQQKQQQHHFFDPLNVADLNAVDSAAANTNNNNGLNTNNTNGLNTSSSASQQQQQHPSSTSSAVADRTVANLREQRDLLQSEVDRLRKASNPSDLRYVEPLGAASASAIPSSAPTTAAATQFVYGVPQSHLQHSTTYLPAFNNTTMPPPPMGMAMSAQQHQLAGANHSNAVAAMLAPLDVNTAAPGTGGLVPRDHIVKAATRVGGLVSNMSPSSSSPAAMIQPLGVPTTMGGVVNGPLASPYSDAVTNMAHGMAAMGALPLGAQPPLHAPYGAFCPPHCVGGSGCAHQHHNSVNNKENNNALFDHINGYGKHNKLRSTTTGGRLKSASPRGGGGGGGGAAVKQHATRLHEELDADRQRAVEQLEAAELKIVSLEGEMRDVQSELLSLRQRAAVEKDRADQLESQVGGAVSGHQRAESLRARAASAMDTMTARNGQLEKEVDYLRRELQQARTYMARFGGIGKDFQNATGDLVGEAGGQPIINDANTATREFFEANDYYRQASAKMSAGEAGTFDEINAVVNYVLGGQGPTSGSVPNASDSTQLLASAHHDDPQRLFMTEKSPYGAGKLGQIALLNSLKNEVIDLKKVLSDRDATIDGLNETIVRLSAEVARATTEARSSDAKYSDTLQRHECDKVLLADAQGEVEYLRLLTGEQTDTLNRLTDEHHRANCEVRHEMDLRLALEAQRDNLSDDVARLSEEKATLLERIDGELAHRIQFLEKTLRELTDDHLAKTNALEEMQRKHDLVNARKVELEEIIEQQLKQLDGTLHTMLSHNSEVARGEEERLRNALALLNDIRRGTAVANATEVVNIAPPAPPAALAAAAPMMMPLTNAAYYGHQQPQLPHNMNGMHFPHSVAVMPGYGVGLGMGGMGVPAPPVDDPGNKGLSPRTAQQRYVERQQQQMLLAQQQQQQMAMLMMGSSAAAPPSASANTSAAVDDSLPPNNAFLQQIRAEKRHAAQQQQQQQSQHQQLQQQHPYHYHHQLSTPLQTVGPYAPFASVGPLHGHDPTTMDTALTSAHAIRTAYAQSRVAAQHALARHEQMAAAEEAKGRSEQLRTAIHNGDWEGIRARTDASGAMVAANAAARLALEEAEATAKRGRAAAEALEQTMAMDAANSINSTNGTNGIPSAATVTVTGVAHHDGAPSAVPMASDSVNTSLAASSAAAAATGGVVAPPPTVVVGGGAPTTAPHPPPPLAALIGASSAPTSPPIPQTAAIAAVAPPLSSAAVPAVGTTSSGDAAGGVGVGGRGSSSSAWGLEAVAALRIAALAGRHHHSTDTTAGASTAANAGGVVDPLAVVVAPSATATAPPSMVTGGVIPKSPAEAVGAKAPPMVPAAFPVAAPLPNATATSSSSLPVPQATVPPAAGVAAAPSSSPSSAWGLEAVAALRIAALAGRHHHSTDTTAAGASTAANAGGVVDPLAAVAAPSATAAPPPSMVTGGVIPRSPAEAVGAKAPPMVPPAAAPLPNATASPSPSLPVPSPLPQSSMLVGQATAPPAAGVVAAAAAPSSPPSSAWGLEAVAALRIAALAGHYNYQQQQQHAAVPTGAAGNTGAVGAIVGDGVIPPPPPLPATHTATTPTAAALVAPSSVPPPSATSTCMPAMMPQTARPTPDVSPTAAPLPAVAATHDHTQNTAAAAADPPAAVKYAGKTLMMKVAGRA